MIKTLLVICGLFILAGCGSSQVSTYKEKTTSSQWNITANKAGITNMISIAIDDSVVVSAKPAPFANTIEAKGTYRGHVVHFFSTYNSGFLGIFGTGWETTVLVDNDLAARFTL